MEELIKNKEEEEKTRLIKAKKRSRKTKPVENTPSQGKQVTQTGQVVTQSDHHVTHPMTRKIITSIPNQVTGLSKSPQSTLSKRGVPLPNTLQVTLAKTGKGPLLSRGLLSVELS